MTKTVYYTAEDGTRFNSEIECKNHEETLKKEQRRKLLEVFENHFKPVVGVSDDMKNYVVGIWEVDVYAFIPFEGWKDLLYDVLGFEGYWETFLQDEEPEEGKRVFLFTYWQSNAYIVDADFLKRRMIQEIDEQWEVQE